MQCKLTYCRFGFFARILFSRIALKDIFSDVKNSQQKQDLAISINDRMILPFREGFIFTKTSHPKFRENKVLTKISEFTVFYRVGQGLKESSAPGVVPMCKKSC